MFGILDYLKLGAGVAAGLKARAYRRNPFLN
jgi:hypothetical protein